VPQRLRIPDEKTALLESGMVKNFREGEIIILNEENNSALMMIETGEISVWLSNTTIDYLQKWDTWNEENFIMAASSDTRLRAETDTTVKFFSRSALLSFFAGKDERLLKRFIINLVNCNYLKWRKAAQRIVMLKLVTGEN